MLKIMGIVNLTPDSFWASSRVGAADALPRIAGMVNDGADIIDLGAVSTRPGAADVDVEEEWRRLEPVLRSLASDRVRAEYGLQTTEFSIDTTSSEIVRRAYDLIGSFIENDISAGEDDPEMLSTVAKLKLAYIAMHKRGNPRTMDSLCTYGDDIVEELKRYFKQFGQRAAEAGVEGWILDPGLGFAKSPGQCWEILERLEELDMPGHPILIGAADKRFTGGDNDRAHQIAALHGAAILRVHDVEGTRRCLESIGRF